MTQEYTPTGSDIKSSYIEGSIGDGSVTNQDDDRLESSADFDRWLAAHDAQIRAEAWAEGHERGWMDGVENAEPASPNPYRKENYLYKSNGLQCEEQ